MFMSFTTLNHFSTETIILSVTLGSVEFWASVMIAACKGAWISLSDEREGSNQRVPGTGTQKEDAWPTPFRYPYFFFSNTLMALCAFPCTLWGPLHSPL